MKLEDLEERIRNGDPPLFAQGERDLNIRLGIAGVASIGTLVFDEPINFIDIVGFHYIISGVYFVNISLICRPISSPARVRLIHVRTGEGESPGSKAIAQKASSTDCRGAHTSLWRPNLVERGPSQCPASRLGRQSNFPVFDYQSFPDSDRDIACIRASWEANIAMWLC